MVEAYQMQVAYAELEFRHPLWSVHFNTYTYIAKLLIEKGNVSLQEKDGCFQKFDMRPSRHMNGSIWENDYC